MKVWLDELKRLHAMAGTETLPPAERRNYEMALDELSRFLLAAQRMSTAHLETPRRVVRVVHALPVVIDATQQWHTRTHQLSPGGFSIQESLPLEKGAVVSAALTVSPADTVQLKAEVLTAGQGSLSFAFRQVEQVALAKIEKVVFDAAIGYLSRIFEPDAERPS